MKTNYHEIRRNILGRLIQRLGIRFGRSCRISDGRIAGIADSQIANSQSRSDGLIEEIVRLLKDAPRLVTSSPTGGLVRLNPRLADGRADGRMG